MTLESSIYDSFFISLFVHFCFLNRLFEQFHVHSNTELKVPFSKLLTQSSRILSAPHCIHSLSTVNILQYNGTTLTPKVNVLIYLKVLAITLGVVLCTGFDRGVMARTHYRTQSRFAALKSMSFPLVTTNPDIYLSFDCLRTSVFSRMSYSWKSHNM